jgi:hypothetical protein
LFAALIGPFFVNWTDYKATFEAEAEKILGRPVEVIGTAHATLLPSPSLTFNEVKVGHAEGEAMMTVDRFSVTIELMPLLQGEFRVVSMSLERPVVRIAVEDDGRLNWQDRSDASKALDPEKIILEKFEIVGGHIDYVDNATGNTFSFEDIDATIEASSLLGPWRIDGEYYKDGAAVEFKIATGRRLDTGEIRVKTDVKPADWPVVLLADGLIGSDEDGVFYKGTYNVAEIVPDEPKVSGDGAPGGDAFGWRSNGEFTLTRQQLTIVDALLSEGPPDRPFSIEADLAIDFGLKSRFEAKVEAPQIDLDRSLGNGPGDPVDVASATESLVAWLRGAFLPSIPGTIEFTVPGIVVGGAVVQKVGFTAHQSDSGWRLEGFEAGLPGRARLTGNGVLATEGEVSFTGNVGLKVDQPTIFAKWWRGASVDGSGMFLLPFTISGEAKLAPQRFTFEEVEARIGEAAISGGIAWSDIPGRSAQRVLQAGLSADSIDFIQLKALAELIAGKDLASSDVLADSYDIDFSAGALQLDDVNMRDVAIDASFTGDALIVNEFGIGDLGGASLNVTQGRIDSVMVRPRGHLDAQLEAETLTGLARVVERILPGHAFSDWLTKAAPSLTPAFITASIEAPPRDGDADFRLNIGGNAAETKLSASFDVTGELANWRQAETAVEINVVSTDAVELARQAGSAAGTDGEAGDVDVLFTAVGVPADGLDVRVKGDFAGIGLRSTGRLAFVSDLPPAFTGRVAVASDNFEPFLRMSGLGIPGSARGSSGRLGGRIEIAGLSTKLALNDSQIAGRLVGGNLTLEPAGKDVWRIGGNLDIDAVDLGWITGLGLGFVLEPTGEAAAPWSRAGFGEPGFGVLTGKVAIAAGEFTIAEGFDATSATMTLGFQPDRISLDVTGSEVVGGTLKGGVSIRNVGGNASLSGRIDLQDATLQSLIWRRTLPAAINDALDLSAELDEADRTVATGTLDVSAEFEAVGRSPASLAASLTGGGTIAIRDGMAQYLNPRAAEQVIAVADRDQEFSEAELLDIVTKQIDGGSLAFENIGGPFAIAGGVVRLKRLAIDTGVVEVVGGAEIDLKSFAIDSDWTVTFDPGDDKARGTEPQVGIVFRGPLSNPNRVIDVLQFSSYLNIRKGERLLEILSQKDAERRELDRLDRLRRKLREDGARRERKAAEVEAARIAAEEVARMAAEEEAARIAAEAERQRLAAEEAARIAAEEEAARIAAEAERQRLAAEEAARIAAEEEAERRRLAAEEAARIAAEEEAARIAAEAERRRLAAEEAARRIAEAEAARIAAEEEAARVAAEAERQRLAAEEAARIAAEEQAARVAAEAERQRLAAEEAARIAAEEEAARIAVEVERRRLAAEESARKIAEAEAARIAAEKEAARVAAEAERQRLAAEEARRKAAAEEAARIVAEEEAARIAVEIERQRREAQEALRIAAEKEAARLAAEEAARIAAEQEAARAAAEAERQRLAAEEARRKAAAEEAARIAAEEEAARIAAEVERQRLAAEEAARIAAEEEAERQRLAAEEALRKEAAKEAARIAAKEEAIRLAVEAERQRIAAQEAERIAAEENAARVAAEAERQRLAAEAERRRLANEEAARIAAQEEAARLAAEADRQRLTEIIEQAARDAEAKRKNEAERTRNENLQAARSIAMNAAARAADAAAQLTDGLTPIEPEVDETGVSPLSETELLPSPIPIVPAEPFVLTPSLPPLESPLSILPPPTQ